MVERVAADPVFTSLPELQAWVLQRLRYPDPARGALKVALADIRRVTDAHRHLADSPA